MYEVIAEHDIINGKVLFKHCIIVLFLGIRYCLMATKRIYYARYAMDMISLVKKKMLDTCIRRRCFCRSVLIEYL